MKSQTTLILEALLRGEGLTPLDALERFNCFRLGARIEELRRRGYDIETRAVSANGKHYARYTIRAATIPPAFPVERKQTLFENTQ